MVETVECKYCGKQTQYTATRECVNCHEVVTRLDEFLENVKARWYVMRKLLEIYEDW